MIEITEVRGRSEVYSPDRRWEAFGAKLLALATTLALSAEIESETGKRPVIIAPWPVYPPQESQRWP